MHIKRYILTSFIILLSFVSFAQEVVDYTDFFKQREYPKSLLYMKLGYEHTQINGSIFNTEMAGIYTPARWVDVYGGFHVSTRNLYQVAARGDFETNIHIAHTQTKIYKTSICRSFLYMTKSTYTHQLEDMHNSLLIFSLKMVHNALIFGNQD